MKTMKMLPRFLILWTTLLLSALKSNGFVVELTSGKVEGFVTNSTDGFPYAAFLSIPYAKPPVGKLRFKPPQPADKWTGVLNATLTGPFCPQISMLDGKYQGDEDCLQLNVYTRKTNNEKCKSLLPVMVYIYGSAFMYQSGHFDIFGPQRYLNYPIVLVTFNYRLGVLGFLSTNDSSAYGNYAMLDQVMAFKWVQNNIERFGGDPNQVTIFGDSAGSASVVLHLLSPLSKNLFKRGIAESGTGINDWSVQRNSLNYAKQLATSLNSSTTSSQSIVECISHKSAKDIAVAARRLQTTSFLPIIWAPVIEPPGGPGFLTEDPTTLLKRGQIANKVPLIIGITEVEGYLFYLDLANTFKYNGSEYFQKQFPSQLPLFSFVQPNMTKAVDAIDNEYLKNKDLNNGTVFTYVLSRILSDAFIDAGVSQTADLLSKSGVPVYTYNYNYKADNCISSLFGGKCGIYTTHGDEVFLQFRFLASSPFIDADDSQMSDIINDLWIEFAYNRKLLYNGVDAWPKYNNLKPQHVKLTLPPTIVNSTLSDKTTFWTETIPSLISEYTNNKG